MGVDVAGALPVRLVVDDRLRDQLVPWLEGRLGWQVTESDELPAAVALVGVGAPTVDLPSVLLVRDDDAADRAVAAAAGAAATVRWPDGRDGLSDVVAEVLGRHRAAVPDVIRLGGAAGGVGTTTVALGLGGLLAWHGHRVLAVVSGDVPVPAVPVVPPEALAAHRTWQAATPVAGVSGLRVIATLPGERPDVTAPPDVVVLRDDGVALDVDVLVCARDRAGVEAVRATPAAVVVVVATGPLGPAAWTRAGDDAVRQVVVEHSTRVARAGVQQRVPASLPGRWLAPLQPLAASIARNRPPAGAP